MTHNPCHSPPDCPGTAESHVPPRDMQACSTPDPQRQR